MTGTLRPVEVELKYRVLDLKGAERYLAAPTIGPFIGASQPRSTQLEDRYVDTPDRAFERAGFAVRLRSSGTGVIVSVKGRGRRESSDGSFSREEIEGPAIRAAGPSDWPASDARSLVLELAGDAPLVEVVTIRQLRRKRQLRDGSTRVELSLDEVDVVVSKRVVARFVELEAELVRGDEARLRGLASALAGDPALRPATTSKLEDALAAVRGIRLETDGRDDDRPAVDVAATDGAAEEPMLEPRFTSADPVASDASDEAPAAEAEADGVEALVAIPIVTDEVAEADDEAETAEVEDEANEAVAENAEIDEDDEAEAEEEADPVNAIEVEAGATEDEDDEDDDGPAVEDVPSSSDTVREAVEGAPSAEPEKATLPVSKSAGVTADDHIAEAGRKVMRFHLARMLAREAGTRAGADAEELHAMRVATRRQRAAWRVFGPAFRQGRTRRYRRGLREVAARLGAVRDLDVLLEAADHYRDGLPAVEQRALEPLLDDWREHREAARQLLIRELDSDAYRRWVDDYRDFVRTDGMGVLPVGPVQPHRVRDVMPSAIWAAYEGVRAYEPVLRWADVETLHDLRIAGKWLRYTIEFVREALGPEATQIIERVTALQDHLGLMHDADVSASMARAFLVEHAGELSSIESAAIGRYLVNREREVARLRRTLNNPWRAVDGPSFRRALGRVVAGL